MLFTKLCFTPKNSGTITIIVIKRTNTNILIIMNVTALLCTSAIFSNECPIIIKITSTNLNYTLESVL